MRHFTTIRSFATLAVASALSACGGGGGNSSAAPPPPDLGTSEGLWGGTTGTNRTIAGLVLDDGHYWFIYTAVGNNAVIGGAVEGSSTSSSGNFNSSDGLNFNLEGQGITGFTLAGTYTKKSKLGGTLTYTGGTTDTFTSTYNTDYDLTPSIATVAGTYSGSGIAIGGSVELVTVTISSVGAITGMGAGGCSFTGTASLHAKGNVYDVSITFGGGVCVAGTGTVAGVAHYDASQKQLISAALNSGRTSGFLFEGVKP